MSAPAYAELQVTSNFSFLRGASHPQEMVEQAKALGLSAIAITDRNTLAGVVRAHVKAKELDLRCLVGARLDFTCGAPSLLCLPQDRAAYGRLARLLTRGQRRAPKGECHLTYSDLLENGEGQVLIALPPLVLTPGFEKWLSRLRQDFQRRVYLAVSRLYGPHDAKRLHRLATLARNARVAIVATGDVLSSARIWSTAGPWRYRCVSVLAAPPAPNSSTIWSPS